MTLVSKVAALLTAIRTQDVQELAPAERQRLASLCRHVATLAEPPALKSGVLCDLKAGGRTE
jgi:hypothetical protein